MDIMEAGAEDTVDGVTDAPDGDPAGFTAAPFAGDSARMAGLAGTAGLVAEAGAGDEHSPNARAIETRPLRRTKSAPAVGLAARPRRGTPSASSGHRVTARRQ